MCSVVPCFRGVTALREKEKWSGFKGLPVGSQRWWVTRYYKHSLNLFRGIIKPCLQLFIHTRDDGLVTAATRLKRAKLLQEKQSINSHDHPEITKKFPIASVWVSYRK